MTWLQSLAHELRAAGIPAGRRRRIVLELADHLTCDPEADARLGAPEELARRFADELGTVLARRAAFGAFLALIPLGVLLAAVSTFTALYTTNVEAGLTVALVVGVQLAFVGGTLALLRAWRLRRAAVIPAAEAMVLVRRAALGLAGGIVTVAAVAALASGRRLGVQWSSPALAWITVGVGAASLVAGGAALVRAARLRPVAAGRAGDVRLDLGQLLPSALQAGPWRVALAVAAALALAIAVDGAVLGDGLDGLVRGAGDGLLCLAGFALLGRPLGLRR